MLKRYSITIQYPRDINTSTSQEPTGNVKGTLQKTKKKSLKGETSKGTKERDTGNIVIKLFITIRTNNPITHFS